MPERIILHIDMDAFFASVEQRDNPQLRARPVAVVGRGGRTVVVTSSYEARALGVRTGMNKFEVKRICPGVIFVEACHEKYTQTCREIVKILYAFSPDIEVYSIDESFLDITNVRRLLGEPLEIGRKIKQAIREKLDLSCSVGIGPNKLLAKLAGSRHKPDGLFRIKAEDAPKELENLPVDELCGIGKKTTQVLNSLGIYTCSQLAKADPGLLRKRFGIGGEILKQMGAGKDDATIMPFGYEPKACSIGHSMTLEHDISACADIARCILGLSDMVGRRMRREGLSGRTISVVFRYSDFHTFSRQKKIPASTDDTRVIYSQAMAIIGNTSLSKPLRLLGVSVSGLEKNQEDFFLFEEDARRKKLSWALDSINGRFGEGVLRFAALLGTDEPDRVISPSWRPCGARKY
ncbi:MAG: DNA polymerase IV [Candidatus Omnitrophota bacterium]